MSEAHRVARTILAGARRVRNDDLRALAIGFIAADDDRDQLVIILNAKRAEVDQLAANVDEERLALRKQVAALRADLAGMAERVDIMTKALNQMADENDRLRQFERSHIVFATLAMHAKQWRHAQRNDQARQALIDSVDSMGEA